MTMTPVRVLRDVRVAHPGTIYGREIVAGTDDEIPAELFESLKAAGYVAAPVGTTSFGSVQTATGGSGGSPAQTQAVTVTIGAPTIPADWRDLHHMKLIALAKLFDADVSNKAEAIAVLEREEKALAGAAENKAIGAAPENKSV